MSSSTIYKSPKCISSDPSLHTASTDESSPSLRYRQSALHPFPPRPTNSSCHQNCPVSDWKCATRHPCLVREDWWCSPTSRDRRGRTCRCAWERCSGRSFRYAWRSSQQTGTSATKSVCSEGAREYRSRYGEQVSDPDRDPSWMTLGWDHTAETGNVRSRNALLALRVDRYLEISPSDVRNSRDHNLDRRKWETERWVDHFPLPRQLTRSESAKSTKG